MSRTIEWDPKNISITRHPSATQHPSSTHPASSTQPAPWNVSIQLHFFGNLIYQSSGSCPSQLDITRDFAEDSMFSRASTMGAPSTRPKQWCTSRCQCLLHATSRILPIHTQYHRRIDTDRQPSRYPNWLSLNNLVPSVNSISRSGRFCHPAHPLITPHLFGHDAMRTENPLFSS